MKPAPVTHASRPGATLVEAVIAIGVLAVAIPLVFGALVESGKSGVSSQAETRGTWIIDLCMEEIRASREGRSRYFEPTVPGQGFPPAGGIWALAFSKEGKPIGRISQSQYDGGCKLLNGESVHTIASLFSVPAELRAGTASLLEVRVSLEYPAAVQAARRQKLDFHTRVP